MTVQDLAIELLKAYYSKSEKPDFQEIASEIRQQLGSKTTINSVKWYASKFKNEITNGTDPTDEDMEIQINVALNLDSNENEIANWEIAEKLVLEYETQQGRNATIVTNKGLHNTLGYDIISKGSNGEIRHIEVKSKVNRKFTWLQLTPNETTAFQNVSLNYFIYLVEGNSLDPNGDIKIVEVSKEELREMAIKKEVVRFSRLSMLPRKKINL